MRIDLIRTEADINRLLPKVKNRPEVKVIRKIEISGQKTDLSYICLTYETLQADQGKVVADKIWQGRKHEIQQGFEGNKQPWKILLAIDDIQAEKAWIMQKAPNFSAKLPPEAIITEENPLTTGVNEAEIMANQIIEKLIETKPEETPPETEVNEAEIMVRLETKTDESLKDIAKELGVSYHRVTKANAKLKQIKAAKAKDAE